MAQVKMDIDQVRQFGNDLKGKYVQELQQIRSNIQSQSNGLQWDGSDAQQFKGDRTNAITSAIDNLVRSLEELGSVAVNNANNQESTSNAI